MPQLMPEPETEPVPVPLFDTVRAYCVGWLLALMYAFTQRPDSVSWLSGHGPVALAPETSADALSTLSCMDQLAELMRFWSIQLVQFCDSLGLKPPSPDASTVPHSVTMMACPAAITWLARSRSHCPCVPA